MRTWSNTHHAVPLKPRPTVPTVVRSFVTPPPDEAFFRNEGEYWRILYKGKSVSLRASKGVFYLAHLLRHPEEHVHSHMLAQITEANGAATSTSPPESSSGNEEGADPAMERVRKAVTNRIRETIVRIARQHPALGRHLANGLQTGLHCVYRPESKMVWMP
jgi:hypothetical protein